MRCIDHGHRTYLAVAKCRWPRANWITGEGEYAVISDCKHGPTDRDCMTVTLWPTLDEAAKALAQISWTGCGGRCSNDHSIVRLER